MVDVEGAREDGASRGVSRRTIMKGAAWTVPALMVATSAPAYAQSAFGCHPVGTLFNAQSRARLLSGAIAGANLDTIASVDGSHAQAFSPAVPGSSNGSISDTKSAALQVTALDAIQLNFGTITGMLSSLLTDLTAQNSGLLNQFAYANQSAGGVNTAEIGGAGAVNQATGALTLDTSSPAAPALATIDL